MNHQGEPKVADVPDATSARSSTFSVDTVKSHARELYRKRGATSQTEAVTRADTFGVLDLGQSPG